MNFELNDSELKTFTMQIAVARYADGKVSASIYDDYLSILNSLYIAQEKKKNMPES